MFFNHNSQTFGEIVLQNCMEVGSSYKNEVLKYLLEEISLSEKCKVKTGKPIIDEDDGRKKIDVIISQKNQHSITKKI